MEVVGLAGQQNDVIAPVELALLDGLHLGSKFITVLRLYNKAFFSKLNCASWPNEKCNVSSAPDKQSAEIAP
jgi:hypothetical protein